MAERGLVLEDRRAWTSYQKARVHCLNDDHSGSSRSRLDQENAERYLSDVEQGTTRQYWTFQQDSPPSERMRVPHGENALSVEPATVDCPDELPLRPAAFAHFARGHVGTVVDNHDGGR